MTKIKKELENIHSHKEYQEFLATLSPEFRITGGRRFSRIGSEGSLSFKNLVKKEHELSKVQFNPITLEMIVHLHNKANSLLKKKPKILQVLTSVKRISNIFFNKKDVIMQSVLERPLSSFKPKKEKPIKIETRKKTSWDDIRPEDQIKPVKPFIDKTMKMGTHHICCFMATLSYKYPGLFFPDIVNESVYKQEGFQATRSANIVHTRSLENLLIHFKQTPPEILPDTKQAVTAYVIQNDKVSYALLLIDHSSHTVEYFDPYMSKPGTCQEILKTINQNTDRPYELIFPVKKSLAPYNVQAGTWICFLIDQRIKNKYFDVQDLQKQLGKKKFQKMMNLYHQSCVTQINDYYDRFLVWRHDGQDLFEKHYSLLSHDAERYLDKWEEKLSKEDPYSIIAQILARDPNYPNFDVPIPDFGDEQDIDSQE